MASAGLLIALGNGRDRRYVAGESLHQIREGPKGQATSLHDPYPWMRGLGTRQDCQGDVRRVLRAAEDLEPVALGAGRRNEGLRGAEVAASVVLTCPGGERLGGALTSTVISPAYPATVAGRRRGRAGAPWLPPAGAT
jgi:hypothetical protein